MGLEKTVMSELDEQLDVQDVYFDRGVLHVINAYDAERVTAYMKANYPSVKVKIDEDYLADTYNPFDTVNS
jgi:hypothetical protein